jgi:RHS repeat-associated protein
MVGEEQGHYPFGEPWYETSPETTRIFTTYEREAGGSLDYAMFRWMGPEAGRFLSADPVHGSMGDGQSWNRYAYAGNDPVNRWDPWGLEPKPYRDAHDVWSGEDDGIDGGGGGGGPSQCDPYDVSICRNTQTGEIVTCCCSGGRWVQCDFTLSEADHEPIDPVERHENWIRETDDALGLLMVTPGPADSLGPGASFGMVVGLFAFGYFSVLESGQDKYEHCMVNCRSGRVGVIATGIAGGLSVAKEIFDLATLDPLFQSRLDMEANRTGAIAGRTGQNCQAVCEGFLLTPVELGPAGR